VHYHVGNLGPERVRQAFSLVQAVNPQLSLEAWRRYARPRVERRGTAARTPRRGILCLENRQGCILALFAFRVEADLHLGRVLHCDYLAAVDLLNPRQALGVLILGFRRCAETTGCLAIRVVAPRALGALSASLVDSGYDVDWIGHGLTLEDAAAERVGVRQA
jgi:hypothetical protein